ncbi:MAG: glycosyltransferase family 1 protein, partial [Lachnospiraceae bacterium]|nr:glycosyltransferase family 1 protein [Lachnospiraceae bacterium]
FVVGHIGRFTYQKNHGFLIDIFQEVYRKNPKAVLLLAGEGELEGEIRRKAERLGLEQAVIFYGTCQDTSLLYQAMDVFCLPSFYEGFGLVALEAQCGGLSVVASKEVPREIALFDDISFLSLKEKAEVWAEELLHADKNEKKRQDAWKQIEKRGFSIQKEAGELLEYYAVKSGK